MRFSALFQGIAAASGSLVRLPSGLELTGKQLEVPGATPGAIDSSVDQYIGVPFADPPVGPLRFRPPNPYSGTWKGAREFTIPPPGCYTGKDRSSEDCLYLNVFRPSNIREDERLPVLVWIFGGGFVNGKIDMYDGTQLAHRNRVIVVVPAYRLGMLGFFASNASFQESGTTGNWGIMDQRLALQWVQANIHAFGGDESRVVISGQSAGAFSIATHLVSPGSQGLFSGAILSSPTTHSSYFFQDKDDSFRFSDWAARTLAHCKDGDDLECLRSVPVSRLVVRPAHRDFDQPEWASRLFPFMPWGITIDGVMIDKTPLELAKLGKVANVPVIMGITQDEGAAFAMAIDLKFRPKFKGDIPADLLRNISVHLLANETLADSVLEMYMPSDEGSPTRAPESVPTVSSENILSELAAIRDIDISLLTAEELAVALPSLVAHRPPVKVNDFDKKPFFIYTNTLKDSLFTCPTMAFADAISAANGGRVYTYNFGLDVWADTTSREQLIPKGGNLTFADLGAFHGSEIPFIWNLFPDKDLMPDEAGVANMYSMYTARNFCPAYSFKRAVANEIGCLWTNLAKCGKPQCDEDDCLIDQVWEPHTNDQFLNIHGRGAYTMTSKTELIGKCPLWEGVRIPFLDFRQPVSETPVLRMDAKTAAPLALSLSAILCVLFI